MERNNSLEITKQLVKDGKISQEIAQTIFPELAESDDERIRKHIVKFIDETFPRHSEEKTKECEEMLSWLEKLKEQKPAEWSEEDERMLSRCIKSVECSKRFANSETYKAAKDVEMNWLKDLSERFNLQPKQEWNEDEKKKLNRIYAILGQAADTHKPVRAIFQQGYEMAEKDLALTWEDVRTILDKENDILHECNDNAQQVIEVYPKGEDYYGEILKRFNEQREKK